MLEKFKIKVPAGKSTKIDMEGNRIFCESATGEWFMNVPGVASYTMKAKRTIELQQPVSSFEVENRLGVDNDIVFLIGDDKITDNEVSVIGSMSVQGDVAIVNSDTVGKTTLKIDETTNIYRLGWIQLFVGDAKDGIFRIEDMLKGVNNNLRNGSTNLKSATRGSASNNSGLITLVTAAANTKGILIRYANIYDQGNISVDGIPILACVAGNSINMRDLIVPANQALTIQTSNGGASAVVYYEVLTT